jgi:hypothetical protein
VIIFTLVFHDIAPGRYPDPTSDPVTANHPTPYALDSLGARRNSSAPKH